MGSAPFSTPIFWTFIDATFSIGIRFKALILPGTSLVRGLPSISGPFILASCRAWRVQALGEKQVFLT